MRGRHLGAARCCSWVGLSTIHTKRPMKHSRHAAFAAFLAAFAVIPSATATAAIVTLETPSLGAALYDDDWRPAGGFSSGGAFFNNAIGDFGTWSGFALSRVTDNTTAGFANQYSA